MLPRPMRYSIIFHPHWDLSWVATPISFKLAFSLGSQHLPALASICGIHGNWMCQLANVGLRLKAPELVAEHPALEMAQTRDPEEKRNPDT